MFVQSCLDFYCVCSCKCWFFLFTCLLDFLPIYFPSCFLSICLMLGCLAAYLTYCFIYCRFALLIVRLSWYLAVLVSIYILPPVLLKDSFNVYLVVYFVCKFVYLPVYPKKLELAHKFEFSLKKFALQLMFLAKIFGSKKQFF